MRRVSRRLALAGALACLTTAAQAQRSTSPISLYVGFAAGGPADTLARIVAEKLGARLGRSVVVQNKPGAGGTVAATQVAKADADGMSLLLVSSGHAGASALYPNLPFDSQKDFVPVIALAQTPIVILVKADSPYRTIANLLAAARAAPGKLNFGTGGGGATLTAMAAVLLQRELDFKAEAINFRGSGPANLALMAGQIDFQFDTVSGAIGLLNGGTLRALAVTSPQRSAVLPDVPTIAETVKPGFDVTGWFGILGPAGLSAASADELNQTFNAILADKATRERLAGLGLDPIGGTPRQFADLLASETARWGGIIRDLGLKPD
ncbi:MAG: tripartite tricarboxylate transporter substrate binding protein [Reyranella sp.]|nr:tripartite tricarboxylate transporter substrate binding protein [Reyranella sp.]